MSVLSITTNNINFKGNMNSKFNLRITRVILTPKFIYLNKNLIMRSSFYELLNIQKKTHNKKEL